MVSPTTSVSYERHERPRRREPLSPCAKCWRLAFDGITSLSNKPIRIITGAGIIVSLISFIGVIWAIVAGHSMGCVVAGWASIVCIVCFMGGVQLVCLGVIGEYIGKIYMETPRPAPATSQRAHMGPLRKEVSRMSKQSWRGSTLLNPEPPVLVSCGGLEQPNLITIGWTGTICTQPSMVSISVRPERFSHHLIQESGQFAINLPTEKLVRSVDWCGVKSGREVGQNLPHAASTLRRARVLTDCPILEESPVNLECKGHSGPPALGSHDLFLPKSWPVMWTNPCWTKAANSVSKRPNSSSTVTASIWPSAKKLGTFGYSVRKKKRQRK